MPFDADNETFLEYAAKKYPNETTSRHDSNTPKKRRSMSDAIREAREKRQAEIYHGQGVPRHDANGKPRPPADVVNKRNRELAVAMKQIRRRRAYRPPTVAKEKEVPPGWKPLGDGRYLVHGFIVRRLP